MSLQSSVSFVRRCLIGAGFGLMVAVPAVAIGILSAPSPGTVVACPAGEIVDPVSGGGCVPQNAAERVTTGGDLVAPTDKASPAPTAEPGDH